MRYVGGWGHRIRLTSVVHIISYLVLANFFHHDQRTFPTVGSNNSMDLEESMGRGKSRGHGFVEGKVCPSSETTLVDRSCDPSS